MIRRPDSGDVSLHRGETLSTRWDSRQASNNIRYGNSSSGSSHTNRTYPEGSSRDEDPWTRKTLLCLDGGGVRGYSSVLILKALMDRVAELEKEDDPRCTSSVYPLCPRPRRPVRVRQTRTDTIRRHESPEAPIANPRSPSAHYLPAHYFDYMAGTSTGGLIAIMLSRLHLTVDECLEAYENLAQRVFAHPRPFHIRKPPWIPRDKYDHEPLEKVIKEIVKQRDPLGSSGTSFRQPNPEMSRTIVIAWRKLDVKGVRVPYLFRSYRHPRSVRHNPLERNPDGPDNYKIWEVGRATSAAPLYFRAMKLDEDDDKAEYIDGGFGANNPAEEAYRSIKQLSKNNKFAVKELVSIGTGKNLEAGRNPSAGYALYLRYANAAAKWAAQSEKTHETMLDITDGRAEYTRLNVEQGLGKMKLDEWKGKRGCKTLDLIRNKTQDYLRSTQTQAVIDATARRLVNVRRARSNWQRDPDRWERFCHGIEYACCIDPCLHGDERFSDRQKLRRHIEDVHPNGYQPSRIESLLDEGKIYLPETSMEAGP